MGFLTPALTLGAFAIAVPIVLHLVMRRQPQVLEFPALRFVQRRRESNRRRMQLRHLLLLALRCGVIGLLAVALARPTWRPPQTRGKAGAPLAAALVVDNSPRMEYVELGRTRLEAASEAAVGVLKRLPADAQATVVDLAAGSARFALDAEAAIARVERLASAADARELAAAVVDAIELTAAQTERQGQVFVFSDLARGALNDAAVEQIATALAAAPEVQLALVDVSGQGTRNVALGELVLSGVALRTGEPLRIETTVAAPAASDPPLVELLVADGRGELVKRGQQLAALGPPGDDDVAAAQIEFSLDDLPLGTVQGVVQLAATDALPIDDRRFFTVEVRPAAKVLLAGETPADVALLREALAPSLFDNQPQRFSCTAVAAGELVRTALEDYQAVLVVDPPPLPTDAWTALWDYVEAGGGVGVFLGHNATSEAFNAPGPQRLLPGRLKRISRDATYFRPRRLDHPALAGLKAYAETIPWQVCRVDRYWQFEQIEKLTSDAYIVAGFANGQPALVQRAAGRGRLLVATTPWSEPLNPRGREPWNELAAPSAAWPFVALCDQLVGYLARDVQPQLDYLAGDTATLSLAPGQRVTTFVLRTPDGQGLRRTAGAGDGSLSISSTSQPGNYRVTSGGDRLDRGFSVNIAAEYSELARRDPAELAEALPAKQFQLVAGGDEAANLVAEAAAGRELYPWAIGLVALVWSAEHLLANRFYGSERGAKLDA